jgi:lipopolysaccharide transport system ATP-binding protein
MSNTAIHIENLSKKYRIGAFSPDTIRDQIVQSFTGLFSAKPSPATVETNMIWALKDINLDIKQGEILGIIGHNGAGKAHCSKFCRELLTRLLVA